MASPVRGQTAVVGQGFKLSRTPASVAVPPPEAGEQSEEILAEVGYDAQGIAALRAAGAI
jgi:crotonobetainyl-CoA:carnitine CoA-transferase CaiB-like acyl-CoA transferase